MFFLKGLTPEFSGAYQSANSIVSTQKTQNTKAVFNTSNSVCLLDLDFFTDDNEDEFSSEKKKTGHFHALADFNNSNIFFNSRFILLKIAAASFNSVGYPFSDK